MKLFGKKKDEDEEGEEEPRKVKRKRTRRKKKEENKPWTKKERILVLAVIILTAGSSAFLSLSAREWKLPGFPRFSLPKISSNFFGSETIVLEGDKGSEEDGQKAQEAENVFSETTKGLSGVYGLYVVRLGNGSSYGVNQREAFQAASLIKLPVMAAMYLENANGEIDLDEKYVLKNSDKLAGAGTLYGKPSGYEITYRELMRLMGKQSDNTAFNIARNLLGDEKIESYIKKFGMSGTSLSENETTPYDIGEFFEDLWSGNILSTKDRDELLSNLTDTYYEEWLAAGIPVDIRIAHKYGREIHVVNDAGIVFSDKPYVIVILSKGVVEREADEAFPDLSKAIYEIETGN